MPLVALYWDQRRISVAIARRSGGRLLFERALTAELMRTSDDEALGPKRLGEKLRAVLQANGVSRGEATVIVSRGSIEMRQFEVPPVPEQELPDLVRFQAKSHFNALGEGWALDFIPIATSNGKSTSILAAAISPEKMEEIRKTIDLTGLRLRHIVVRPFATVELLRYVMPDAPCLITVEPSGRQANLSVVDQGHLLFTRTVRVPESYTDDQFDLWLPGEVQRTIAAARNQCDAPEVTKIVVFAKSSEHERLEQGLSESFDIPTEFFNPFDAVALSREFEYPDRFDGFASLLGSIVQQSFTDNRSLDFVNPRRKEQTDDPRRKLVLAGAIAAGVFLISLVVCWWILRSRDAEIAELRANINSLSRNSASWDEVINRVDKVDEWKKGDILWIEELYEISQRFPLPDDAIVDSFIGNLGDKQASIELRGRVRSEQQHSELSDRLSARPYKIEPKNRSSAPGDLAVGFTKDLRFGLADVSNIGKPTAIDNNDSLDEGNASISEAGSAPEMQAAEQPPAQSADESIEPSKEPPPRELPK